MKKFFQTLLLGFVLVMVACQSIPSKILLSPNTYSDDKIKIEYSFGTKAYNIRITNLTDNELFIDIQRCSIISITGETKNLLLVPNDSHIPPRANLVLSSTQQVLFSTDIDTQFKSELNDGQYLSESEFIKKFIGQRIRLFIPVSVENEEKIYDLLLTIEGVEKLKRSIF